MSGERAPGRIVEEQVRKAEAFRRLHTSGDDIVVLPCAWDVASAKIFEMEGFAAVGTTSLGVAASGGQTDGQRLDFGDYLDLVRKICVSVRVPVSVDVEAGYATTVEGVVANMREVLRAGAVGINIEDEDHQRSGGRLLEPLPFMLEKIRAVRAMSDAYGVPLFINAKTDAIWLSGVEAPEAAFREAVERANAYGAAGADCVFIPGDLDRQAISGLVAAIPHPLNVVVKANTPPVAMLRSIGVRRVSLGSGPMRATMGLTRQIAREVLAGGTYQHLLGGAIPSEEVRTMFAS